MREQLSPRTAVLLPPGLHDRMRRVARSRGRSLGDLVREACAAQYGGASPAGRLAAVEAMARLALPVGTPHERKRESLPRPVQRHR
jgi:hypothetical protein